MIKKIGIVALLLVLGQLINALGSPVITRIYSPENLGVFSVYLAALYIGCSFSSFRFDKKILTAKSQKLRSYFLFLGVIFSCVISILIFLVSTITFSTTSLITPDKFELISILTLTIPLYVSFQCCLNVLVSKNRAQLAASIRLVQICLMVVLQIVIGYFTLIDNALEFGYLLSFLVSNVIVIIYAELRYSFVLKTLVKLFFSNFKQNAFGSLSNFLNVTSIQLITILLASFFGETEVGFYAVAFRVLIAPSGVFTQAIVQSLSVNVRHWVSSDQHDKVRKFIRYNALGSLAIFGCLFCIVFFIGESGFSLLFGEGWSEVYHYALAVFPWLFTSAIISPSSILFVFYRCENNNLIFTLYSLSGKVVAILISQLFFSALITVFIVSIVTALINLCGVLFLYQFSKRASLKTVD